MRTKPAPRPAPRLALAFCLLLTGCAGNLAELGTSEPARIASYMAGAASLSSEAQAAEIGRLQAAPMTPTDRLKLAWLLSRKGTRVEDLTRARDLLAGQEGGFGDAGSRQLLVLVQRVIRLELELREEQARGAALQDKIERLKNLERSLQDRAKTQDGK